MRTIWTEYTYIVAFGCQPFNSPFRLYCHVLNSPHRPNYRRFHSITRVRGGGRSAPPTPCRPNDRNPSETARREGTGKSESETDSSRIFLFLSRPNRIMSIQMPQKLCSFIKKSWSFILIVLFHHLNEAQPFGNFPQRRNWIIFRILRIISTFNERTISASENVIISRIKFRIFSTFKSNDIALMNSL